MRCAREEVRNFPLLQESSTGSRASIQSLSTQFATQSSVHMFSVKLQPLGDIIPYLSTSTVILATRLTLGSVPEIWKQKLGEIERSQVIHLIVRVHRTKPQWARRQQSDQRARAGSYKKYSHVHAVNKISPSSIKQSHRAYDSHILLVLPGQRSEEPRPEMLCHICQDSHVFETCSASFTWNVNSYPSTVVVKGGAITPAL